MMVMMVMMMMMMMMMMQWFNSLCVHIFARWCWISLLSLKFQPGWRPMVLRCQFLQLPLLQAVETSTCILIAWAWMNLRNMGWMENTLRTSRWEHTSPRSSTGMKATERPSKSNSLPHFGGGNYHFSVVAILMAIQKLSWSMQCLPFWIPWIPGFGFGFDTIFPNLFNFRFFPKIGVVD